MHEQWRRRVSEGMRNAAARRRAAGLTTFSEASFKTLYPVGALKRMADAGELLTVRRGVRRYIPRSELKRLKAAVA